MLEVLRNELKGKSIAMEKVGEKVKGICEGNGQILKNVNADLASCQLSIETDKETFIMKYESFNIMNECFTF